MFKEVDFHLGCRVVSSDGCDLGTLESVLVDEEGFDLRHLVVNESPMASGHHWYRGANMLGHVHDVVYDDGGEMAGIVIRPSGFLTHDVLLQIRFIDRADDLCLFTHVTAEDHRPPGPAPAAGVAWSR